MSGRAFELTDFLPYILNQAAQRTSLDFARTYKDRYDMLRTEWRVVAHLGRHGVMTAKEIRSMAGVHKTKVSRAVKALQAKRFVVAETDTNDRRCARLQLTRGGWHAYDDLAGFAQNYERELATLFTEEEQRILRTCLKRLARIE